MDLRPITQLIQDAGIAEEGISLFIAQMPVTCDEGLLLRPRTAGARINKELPGYIKTDFRVVSRSKTYDGAKTLIDAVSAALDFYDRQAGDYFIKHIRPQTLPRMYPVTEAGYFEMQVDFDICFNY